jgi:hypothetical protein
MRTASFLPSVFARGVLISAAGRVVSVGNGGRNKFGVIVNRPFGDMMAHHMWRLWCVLWVMPLAAQTYGEMTGTVTDASGAIISGATVSVTNQATNQVRQVASNEAGNYTVPFLVPRRGAMWCCRSGRCCGWILRWRWVM